MSQPKSHIQPLALPEEHVFAVELLDRPAQRQYAANQRDAHDGRHERQRVQILTFQQRSQQEHESG
jgi:hypothetical protein